MKSEKLYEAFTYIDDRYLDIADGPPKESIKMKHYSYKRAITFALAAALCISILAVTAVAAGWIPGIFNALQEKYPEEKVLFEAAANANTEAEPTVKAIPQLDYSNFVMYEKYYDGETILLGYDIDAFLPESFVCYEMDTEVLDLMKARDDFGSISWEQEQDWMSTPKTEYARKNNLSGSAADMDRMFKDMLSAEAYEEAWKTLLENGYVCVANYDLWVGDHILVNDVDMFETIGPENSTLRTEYETEEGKCIKLNPLPEIAQNKDAVTVALNMRSCLMYWYMDLDGNAYYGAGNHETEALEFVLSNVNE